MIRVLEILPDKRAVVSTEGLYRVAAGSEIFGELLDEMEADSLVNLLNRLERGNVQAVSYDALAQSTNS